MSCAKATPKKLSMPNISKLPWKILESPNILDSWSHLKTASRSRINSNVSRVREFRKCWLKMPRRKNTRSASRKILWGRSLNESTSRKSKGLNLVPTTWKTTRTWLSMWMQSPTPTPKARKNPNDFAARLPFKNIIYTLLHPIPTLTPENAHPFKSKEKLMTEAQI